MNLNKITQLWLDAYIARPRATVIIESQNDTSTAFMLAERIHETLVQSKNSPMLTYAFQDVLSIGIDKVREIQRSLSLKADAANEISRVVTLVDAHKLTSEAQNALLKLLEELPERTAFILLVERKEALLKTITSRCFIIPVLPMTQADALAEAKKRQITPSRARTAYYLSDGNASEFQTLLGEDNSQLSDAIAHAKQFVSTTIFDRQVMLAKLESKQVDNFLHALELIAKNGMRLAKASADKLRWKQILQSVLECKKQLASNVNTKLVLLRLSVILP